jgi:hypothetical protein
MEHLTRQLDTFPNLRVFTWRGSTNHPEFDTLRERCESQGIEFRVRYLFFIHPHYRLNSS